MSLTITLSCVTHPTYKGMFPSTSGCDDCYEIYFIRESINKHFSVLQCGWVIRNIEIDPDLISQIDGEKIDED
jgi:hypothetical protein